MLGARGPVDILLPVHPIETLCNFLIWRDDYMTETKMTTPFFGTVEIKDETSQFTTLTLDGDKANISVGGTPVGTGISPYLPGTPVPGARDGQVKVLGQSGETAVLFGADADGGAMSLNNSKSEQTAFFGNGGLDIGGHGVDGSIHLFPKNAAAFGGSPQNPTSTLSSSSTEAFVGLGGHGTTGQMGLFPATATNPSDPYQAVIYARTSDASIRAGLAGVSDGRILVSSKDGQSNVSVEASAGNAQVRLGSPGTFATPGATQSEVVLLHRLSGSADSHDAAICIRSSDASIRAGGNLGLDGSIGWGVDGRVLVCDEKGNAKIRLEGSSGDIFLDGADCAEEFDLAGSQQVDPGAVMVLDGLGKLRPSGQAYDRKVAGVVSGAGSYKSGIVLDRQELKTGRTPLALVGKVYGKVDANYSPVEVGDLLTTSDTPGHAMKALDPSRAFGAVIGKALRSLRKGQDLIPILVALQ
jgi:hypothetical protein